MSKLKTFSIVEYHRGIELNLLCVTTSKKKFAELTDKPLSHINNYANSYDLRHPVCSENPDKIYAKPGMGGEAMYIFNRHEIKPVEDYKALIDSHREKFPTPRDFYEDKNKS